MNVGIYIYNHAEVLDFEQKAYSRITSWFSIGLSDKQRKQRLVAPVCTGVFLLAEAQVLMSLTGFITCFLGFGRSFSLLFLRVGK